MTDKEVILSMIRRENINPNKTVGQTCGLPQQKVRLICDQFNLVIEVGFYRSQIKNYETAMILMELALDDLMR